VVFACKNGRKGGRAFFEAAVFILAVGVQNRQRKTPAESIPAEAFLLYAYISVP
jgi:hypothetical protein